MDTHLIEIKKTNFKFSEYLEVFPCFVSYFKIIKIEGVKLRG